MHKIGSYKLTLGLLVLFSMQMILSGEINAFKFKSTGSKPAWPQTAVDIVPKMHRPSDPLHATQLKKVQYVRTGHTSRNKLAQLAVQLAVQPVRSARRGCVDVYTASTGALDQDKPELAG